VALLLLGVGPASAQFLPRGRSSTEVTTVFRSVVSGPSESTVRVRCNDKDAALGTVITADGYIVTKASLLRGRISCVLKDGKVLPAKLVGQEDKYDLAMLKVETKGLKPIEWQDSKTADPGNWLAAPGNSRDPVAIGVVSVATRKTTPRDFANRPAAANSGFLGVMLEDGDGNPVIAEVTKNSAADRAGLKAGDVVIAISGKTVTTREVLVQTIQNFKVGDSVTIKVKRGDDEMELRARLGKRPDSGPDRSEKMNAMGSELSERRTGFPVILQHDMVIKPTDCGGPLVDLDGKAVGINIARAGRVESYAIPSEAVQALLPDLKSGKLAPQEDPRVAELSRRLEGLQNELKIAEKESDALMKDKAVSKKDEKLNEAKKSTLRERIVQLRKQVREAEGELRLARRDPTK